MLAEGTDPYPVELPITSTIKKVREEFDHLEIDEQSPAPVGVAGRVMFIRGSGKLQFVVIQDGEGNRIQVMLSAKWWVATTLRY